MKKLNLFVLFFAIFVILWTPATAKKEFGNLEAPTGLTAQPEEGNICFTWNPVNGAVKYSLDVGVDVDGDGSIDAEFSFGTGDLTDPSVTELCVPLTDFVYDFEDGNGPVQISGMAHVKVKALNPGKGEGRFGTSNETVKASNPVKGKGRQNNAFSSEVNSSLTPSEPPCNDPVICGW
jgi:hypothetical protein